MKEAKISGFVGMTIVALFFLARVLCAAPVYDTTFSGNYIIPENQSGFSQEQYEIKATRKLQRGAENFFLSPLEVPHGVKTEFYQRKAEYLPVGIEHFFLGAFRGIGKGFKRWGVGFYEMITFAYPQEPIVEELDTWLY
jgi:hypothetical protein